MILGDIVRRNAKRYPRKTAVVFGSLRYNFNEFNCRVTSIANALINLGLQREDRIAILLDNCHQFLELDFAIPKAGGVVVPINTALSTGEIVSILKNAEAKMLVFGERFAPVADSLLNQIDSLKMLIVVGAPARETKVYEKLIADYPPTEPEVKVGEQDLAYLLYTSGTTGLAKGVMLTHRALIESCVNLILGSHLRHDDIGLISTPLFWGGALAMTILPQFYMGGTIVINETSTPEVILSLIQREKITTGFLTPPIIVAMLEYPHLSCYEISSLRHVWFAGLPMPVDVLRKALETIGNVFSQCYGSTELPAATYIAPEELIIEGPPEKVRRLASVGREFPNVEVRVVSDEGIDIAPGEVGEIIGRGDHMMKGYWRMSQATEEALKDGYMHTGDLATVDEDGYIYLAGRKKDLIMSGGQAIYPVEVEEAIYHHPDVTESAVIGVPDETLGESVEAVVVLKQGAKVTAEEIIQFCKQRLPWYAVPKSVAFVEALPKNPAGKVLKQVLRKKYRC